MCVHIVSTVLHTGRCVYIFRYGREQRIVQAAPYICTLHSTGLLVVSHSTPRKHTHTTQTNSNTHNTTIEPAADRLSCVCALSLSPPPHTAITDPGPDLPAGERVAADRRRAAPGCRATAHEAERQLRLLNHVLACLFIGEE